MIKVNLVDELLKERNKDISSAELLSTIKNIWSKSESDKKSINGLYGLHISGRMYPTPC